MKKIFILLITLGCLTQSSAQKKPAYTIYSAKGKKVSYSKMLKVLAKADIVLFGELHNNPIAHWLQFEVTHDLHQSRKLILGAEMLEADNQIGLDQYLKGTIDRKAYDSIVRLWPNYKTDYAPLVDFAKTNQLPFVASNIPRRYARIVHKQDFVGLDSLTSEEKSWIAPLPITFDPELPSYKNILTMMGEHGTLNLVKAQAIKDATMAHFILANYVATQLFLHFNGAYHSDNYEGILWYLKQAKPELNYVTISTTSQGKLKRLEAENKGKADFIIVVDEDMTTTY